MSAADGKKHPHLYHLGEVPYNEPHNKVGSTAEVEDICLNIIISDDGAAMIMVVVTAPASMQWSEPSTTVENDRLPGKLHEIDIFLDKSTVWFEYEPHLICNGWVYNAGDTAELRR
ncbi:hypothetical protein BO78DRAFT_386880 [Aspergillus sclerotiicarbonarius CBS 121057]|uniref:Uncharacterized protein n=1 Tax=Aspergillus sclerotiicarbonarius (strain CBS 121057 / IBT 28362) TaxID=1448318 RepID=A0A319FHD4_ASPSB|nr:hypothetical protein BO78DRAFT_386880 [Aspergillus sclerotiicarbonarius CBS 121057]